ncbi:MAG: type I-B CRISPR-associated protein Cas8b1/Cst1 [Clostridium sp.]
MGLIRIETGDWLKNASLIGLLRVLDYKRKLNDKIIIEDEYIEFDSEMLQGFENAYFELLISQHEKQLSWYKLVSYEDKLDVYLEDDKITIKSIESLNKIIDNIKKLINSNSYVNGYLLLDDGEWIKSKEKKLNKIKFKKKDDPSKYKESLINQINVLKEIIHWFKKDEVRKVITAKNVMYDIIQPFWSNVSILLKTNNQKNMYELYSKDFILPAVKYIDSEKSKYKINCFTCNNKIKNISKPEAFDLTWLTKIGVDMSRKSSHFWNMNGDAYICPICNLLYSCLPLGFVVIENKGIFINSNKSINMLKQSNIVNVEYEDKKFEEIENLSYYNIINAMENLGIENIDKEIDNIQVIKFNGNNGVRPYSFNILSPKILKVLYYHRKNMNSLVKVFVKITDKYSLNIYDEVITRIYAGKNLFDLIHQLIILYLDKERFKSLFIINIILKINTSILGGKNMRQEDINRYMSYGNVLREAYLRKNAESKLTGITYRLLNSIKTKDYGKFMDTIINSYMYMKIEIPNKIAIALKDSEKLQSIGYAFVLGLQGEKEEKGEK